MKPIKILCMTLCVAACGGATAAVADELAVKDGDVLSLQQCRDLALANNKSLEAARKLTAKYGYDVKSYRANYFPNFKLMANDVYSNAKGSFGMTGGYLPTYVFNAATGGLSPNVLTDAAGGVVYGADGVPVFKEYAFFPDQKIDYKFGNVIQAGVTVEQPLYMGGKVTAAYRMAKLGLQMSQLNVSLTESEVIVETETAFMMVVKAGEMGKVATQYHTMLKELLSNVQSAHKHGLKPYNDVLKVSVKLNESELQLRQAENGLRLAKMNLCHIIGVPLTTQVEVKSDDLLIRPAAADASADVSLRPEYELLQKKSEMAGEQVKLDRSDFLPNVGLAGTYSYMHGFEVNGKTLLDKPSYGVMLSVSVPLFHFGEGTNKIRAAKMEKDRAIIEQENLVEQMNLELAQTANNLDEAFLEVELTTQSMAEATDNLKTSAKEYEVGLESLVNYLEAQTLWQQAYAAQVESQCKLFISGTKYRKAAGLLK